MSLASVDRKQKIIDLLDLDKQVKVKDLATELRVSTETIRKYLDDLQEEGKLTKVYGGAIPVTTTESELPSMDREVINKEAKEKIGIKAVELIKDSDVIGIDDGSTPFYLAKHLKGKQNLTIVTSSINSLNTLIQSIGQGLFSGKIILLGGEIDPVHQRVVGELSLDMLSNIFVDKYFISADGLSEKGIVTSHDVSKAMMTKKVMEHANENILMLDDTKIGKRGHYRMTDVQNIDILISNGEPPDDNWSTMIDNYKVQWIVANT